MTSKKTTPSAQGQPEPLVIPRSEHKVSRQLIDREALKVLYRLRDEGHTAYLVGGGVRDILLGKIPKDFDISTSAKPTQIRKIFRNSRIIGRRFRLVQVFFGGGKIVEVATFRCQGEDVADEKEVLPSNNTFGTPFEDAFRRDLTINALFYEIEQFTVLDYVGGVNDLNNKLVRLIGDPDRRITRDPVRMMRVIRHAARASFTIEPQTWDAIARHSEKLLLCPVSRIRDELFKDLYGGACSRWAELAVTSGLFFVLFPFCRKVLTEGPEAEGLCELLYGLLKIVDRFLGEGRVLPEHLILSALFLPLVLAESEAMAVKTQKDSYALAHRTRGRLEEVFTRLNLKRSLLDSVSRCLATLPLLLNLKDGESWPKWFRNKSYFANGLLLYHLYAEVTSGKLAEASALPVPPPDEERTVRKSSPSGGPRGVALAPSTKGGVFGFRRN